MRRRFPTIPAHKSPRLTVHQRAPKSTRFTALVMRASPKRTWAAAAGPTRLIPAEPASTWLTRVQTWLPEGRALPEPVWKQRHAIVVWFVVAHAVALPLFGIWRGWSWPLSIGEGALLAALGGIAS